MGPMILGAFGPSPMRLGAFVSNPDLNPFGQGLSGPALPARPNDCVANVKEHVAVTSFTIRQECEVIGLLHHLRERLHRLLK